MYDSFPFPPLFLHLSRSSKLFLSNNKAGNPGSCGHSHNSASNLGGFFQCRHPGWWPQHSFQCNLSSKHLLYSYLIGNGGCCHCSAGERRGDKDAVYWRLLSSEDWDTILLTLTLLFKITHEHIDLNRNYTTSTPLFRQKTIFKNANCTKPASSAYFSFWLLFMISNIKGSIQLYWIWTIWIFFFKKLNHMWIKVDKCLYWNATGKKEPPCFLKLICCVQFPDRMFGNQSRFISIYKRRLLAGFVQYQQEMSRS